MFVIFLGKSAKYLCANDDPGHKSTVYVSSWNDMEVPHIYHLRVFRASEGVLRAIIVCQSACENDLVMQSTAFLQLGKLKGGHMTRKWRGLDVRGLLFSEMLARHRATDVLELLFEEGGHLEHFISERRVSAHAADTRRTEMNECVGLE